METLHPKKYTAQLAEETALFLLFLLLLLLFLLLFLHVLS